MSTEYTIASIPTLYRGRMYRSRLEARWAAFFDRLGWAYEYEPFDMGKWSPDFLLTGMDVLVEVKPVTSYIQAGPTAEKIGGYGKNLLIVGTGPSPIADTFLVGWLKNEHAPNRDVFMEVVLRWFLDDYEPKVTADLLCCDGADIWTVHQGRISLEQFNAGLPYREHTERLWSDACNAVQWEPRS